MVIVTAHTQGQITFALRIISSQVMRHTWAEKVIVLCMLQKSLVGRNIGRELMAAPSPKLSTCSTKHNRHLCCLPELHD